MKYIGLFMLAFTLGSCNVLSFFDGPDTYSDDFENYHSADDLIDGENRRWSFFQLSKPDNSITVDSSHSHGGAKCVRFQADKSDSEASKASINKQFMAFWEGEIVTMEGWFYIEGSKNIDWLFIFDIEEKTQIGANPGTRLAFEDGYLLVEHKYPIDSTYQEPSSGIPFPRNQWVHIRFDIGLSQKEEGYFRVWQDGALILKRDNWQTLPTDLLYFTQGSKGMYDQIEFGITANSKSNETVMYIDDVLVQVTGQM
ncbi:MAG: hypothetical protein D6B26_02460 [Spirochaetaceae bacterium]|nr:MAG: hypothetical protein D6B26_02460 [Spirochaetaceae bacterium]